MIIGASTGWMYAHGIYSLSEQEIILRDGGADAFEISMSQEKRRIDSLNGSERFGDFEYKSLHLPDYDPSRGLEEQLDLTRNVFLNQMVHSTLIHPLNIPIEFLRKLSLSFPMAIENMDRNKSCGYSLQELENLIYEFNLNFVLDVQHAYEHDPEMKYAGELFNLTRNKLVQLHVSGETENSGHSLVYMSRNARKIVNFLGKVISEKEVPIILEGEYKNSDELRDEICFLSRELGFS